MRFRIFFLLLTIFLSIRSEAQLTPTQIRYTSWDLQALRYYPFKERADSIAFKAIKKKPEAVSNEFLRTSVDFVINKDYFQEQSAYSQLSNNWFYKYIIRPYISWMNYAHPFSENTQILNLALFDEEINNGKTEYSTAHSLLDVFGIDNINHFVKENLGNADLRNKNNEILFHSIKTPLNKNYFNDYHYFLSGFEKVDSIPCYEIVFFSKERKADAYEGYLYISYQDHSLVKAVFTLNRFLDKKIMQEILFVQTPDKIETQAFLGSDVRGGLLFSQTRVPESSEVPYPELTPAQKDFELLQKKAENTRAYRNTQKGIYFLLTEHIPGKYLNFGPVFQTVSYNAMEGLRLRAGGNTSERFSRKLHLDGYLAYGFKDEDWKYKGAVSYAFASSDRLSFSYVNDLNIPGHDLLHSRRDNIFYSFTHSGTRNMSLQKIGYLNYEKEFSGSFSFQLGGKYLSDRPQGNVQYFHMNGDVAEIIPELITSEVQFGFRYAPLGKYIRIGNRKININEPDILLDMNHRIGIKGIFNSGYSYHITDFSAYKKFTLGDVGSLSLRISGGKAWDKAPFPLLFIPTGNQSYIFSSFDYNLMRFYEFITDQYIAGNLSLEFNWSPLDFFMKSPIKTGLGIRTIYGSLSEKNDPSLQSDLFVLNNGIQALDNKPYTEVNVGLINILKVFRVDYAYRLNYGRKGSFFLTSSYLF